LLQHISEALGDLPVDLGAAVHPSLPFTLECLQIGIVDVFGEPIGEDLLRIAGDRGLVLFRHPYPPFGVWATLVAFIMPSAEIQRELRITWYMRVSEN
jgi:hypothetical protein